MPPELEEMLELAHAHAALEDPTEIAIWIRQHEREAWLVEVIPTMARDDHPERPVAFTPGRAFRHPLNLIAGNREDIERAIRNDSDLASAVANGHVLLGRDAAQELVSLAQDITAHGHTRAS